VVLSRNCLFDKKLKALPEIAKLGCFYIDLILSAKISIAVVDTICTQKFYGFCHLNNH